MANNNGIKLRLQGHEKFSLRDGWISKGLTAVTENPQVFVGKDGPDILGIGNNMVKSLRYWLKACNLIDEKPGKGATLTELGETIVKYDPYIEDNFTIGVLHSQIAKNLEEATSWYMFFNRCDIEEMEKDKIESILLREIKKYAMGLSFSEKSVKNDLDVLLSMYGKSKESIDPEDKSISPFSQLKLIKCTEGNYSKVSPDKKCVNEWNVLYELAVMMDGKDNISIDKALNDECGITRIYQIKNVVANEYLDKLEAMEYLRVDRTAGLDIIYKTREFTASNIMETYYNKVG